MKKLTFEYIKKYIESSGFVLLSDEYNNSQYKLKVKCNNNHEFDISWNNFQRGRRCSECSNKKKLNIEYINKYALKENYCCTSDVYINSHFQLKWICPYNHKFQMRWTNFQKGRRCPICKIENNSNEKHYNWNPDRYEISLNQKLRIPRTKSWIKNNMKHDINYQEFLKTPDEFHLDHIIPIKAFTTFLSKHLEFNEIIMKKIINKKCNLQLLTIEENYKKYDRYNEVDVMEYIRRYY